MNRKAQVITFRSNAPVSPFAPQWNYFLFESFIDDVNFSELADYILSKEKEVLELPTDIKDSKYSDGYTGLGVNSITSRFNQFNVLNWNHSSIEKIKENILDCHELFLSGFPFNSPDELYIQCWANIMRKGEQIKPHIHSVQPDSYLGGHICVQCENTNTNYINPVNQINDPEVYNSKNEVSKITLFQNCIPHYTDMHNGEKERITIAFDLSMHKTDKNYIKLK